MTTDEIKIANQLLNCTFLPGSFDKKFVKQLPNWIDRDMTEKGRAKMMELRERYRKQIERREGKPKPELKPLPLFQQNA